MISVSLLEAFDLEGSRIIAIIGGGGKSSLMAALGQEFNRRGEQVILSTTTHIFRPKENGYLGDDPAVCAELLREAGVLTVGSIMEDGRIGVSELFDDLPRIADRVIFESDGTKGLPMKVPRETEPVLPSYADTVIAVAGLSALGKPLEEVCHRPELAWEVFHYPPEKTVTPQMMAEILTSPMGQKKGVGSRRFLVLLNQCDAAPRDAARKTAEELIARGVERVVITALQAAPQDITYFIN